MSHIEDSGETTLTPVLELSTLYDMYHTRVHELKSNSIHGEDSSEKCELKRNYSYFSTQKKECTFKKGCTFRKGSAGHHQIQGSLYKDSNEQSKIYQPLSSRIS